MLEKRKSFKQCVKEVLNDSELQDLSNIVEEIFSLYLFWCEVDEILAGKENKVRERTRQLGISAEITPVLARIIELKQRSQAEIWGIQSCMHAIVGSNTSYFIQQFEDYAPTPAAIRKEAKEFVEGEIRFPD